LYPYNLSGTSLNANHIGPSPTFAPQTGNEHLQASNGARHHSFDEPVSNNLETLGAVPFDVEPEFVSPASNPEPMQIHHSVLNGLRPPLEIGKVETAFHQENVHQPRFSTSSTLLPSFEHAVVLGAAALQNNKSVNPGRWPLLDSIGHLIAELPDEDLVDLYKDLAHKKAMREFRTMAPSVDDKALQKQRVFVALNPATTQAFARGPVSVTTSTASSAAVPANSTSASLTSTASTSTTTTTTAENFALTDRQIRNLGIVTFSMPILEKLQKGEELGFEEITAHVDSLEVRSSPDFSRQYIESLRVLVCAADEGKFPELKPKIPWLIYKALQKLGTRRVNIEALRKTTYKELKNEVNLIPQQIFDNCREKRNIIFLGVMCMALKKLQSGNGPRGGKKSLATRLGIVVRLKDLDCDSAIAYAIARGFVADFDFPKNFAYQDFV
jgi:hypothetical protein